MQRAADGDQKAFAELVSRHIDSLYGYARRLCYNDTMAEDLVQDTWLAAWQHAQRYRPEKSAVSTWLHRILHNRFIDHTRRRATRTEHSGSATDMPATALEIATLEASAQEQARQLEQAQMVARLDQCLGELPEQQRAAVTLTHLQGFSNRDVAHILGLSVRATESLLARARRTLRERFSE